MMPEITDEDRAVAEEAYRLFGVMFSDQCRSVPEIAAALVRTGWKPVDPDLILAREVAADTCYNYSWHESTVSLVRDGKDDTTLVVQAALAAIKAVRREGER
jgi:hypothetical protein